MTAPVRSDGRPWWREAVVYQIYTRSFADGNGDGIGDLPGITAHLDYLAGAEHALGIDAIWLCPFYVSPMVDYGYDVADHCAVDPRFGSLHDFDVLLAEAHGRGIRVLVDFIPNHTSDQHPWFEDSRAGRKAEKRDWYVWSDPGPGGGPPNNWLSSFERVGSAWTLDQRTGQYYLHSYTPQQPDLNWWNPRVREAMQDVLRFWLDRGVDGVRIDAAHRMIKDHRLRENPSEVAHMRRAYGTTSAPFRNLDHPGVHVILRSFRRVLDRYDDRVAVGEVGIASLPDMARYYGRGDELHLVFNFDFWRQPWSARAFAQAVEAYEAALPVGAWPDYALSNHDLPRARSRYDERGLGGQRARVMAMMLLTLRGTPFLYYGEEIGMRDGSIDDARAHDPDGRDGARTPMQWSATVHAGFAAKDPWLPIPPSARIVNVETQRADRGSLLNLYRRLLALRRSSAALRHGDHRRVDENHDAVFAYVRSHAHERFLVALNFTDRIATLELDPTLGQPILLLSTRPDRLNLERPMTVAANEGVIARLS
jgi:alpha-glucosidase